MRRFSSIHRALQTGAFVTARTLAQQLESSPRTIRRALDYLRDELHAPLEWDARRGTYRYTAAFDLLSGLTLDGEETLALTLAGETFAAWRGTPLGQVLTAALGKIARLAGTHLSVPADSMRACIYHPADTDDFAVRENRHFATLLTAIIARRVLTITYRKPQASRAEPRAVEPLHLAYLDHKWTLVARDPRHPQWRHFVLARIATATATPKRFRPPPRETIRAHLAGSLGRFAGDQTYDVRLLFAAAVEDYLKETPWHATQTLHKRADGRIEAHLKLNDLRDVQRRVLGYGRFVEVLAPPALRAATREEAAALLQLYAQDKT
jgi:predicted DNA-binding transcriptional regulator YafY